MLRVSDPRTNGRIQRIIETASLFKNAKNNLFSSWALHVRILNECPSNNAAVVSGIFSNKSPQIDANTTGVMQIYSTKENRKKVIFFSGMATKRGRGKGYFNFFGFPKAKQKF